MVVVRGIEIGENEQDVMIIISVEVFCSTSTPKSSVVQPLTNYVNMKGVHTDNNTMLDETSDRASGNRNNVSSIESIPYTNAECTQQI